jgi:hypothetical protein
MNGTYILSKQAKNQIRVKSKDELLRDNRNSQLEFIDGTKLAMVYEG